MLHEGQGQKEVDSRILEGEVFQNRGALWEHVTIPDVYEMAKIEGSFGSAGRELTGQRHSTPVKT